MRLSDLSEIQLDALREVGSIGAGHAATALSQLVDRPVDLTVPVLDIVPVSQVPHAFGGPERLVAAVYARLVGDIAGGILFLAARDDALSIVDFMQGRPAGTAVSLGHDEEGLLTHVGSILLSNYLAAIARLTDLHVLPSRSLFALDMAGGILEVATLDSGTRAEHAVMIHTDFVDEETSIAAGVFFMPDPESLEILLGRLGLV